MILINLLPKPLKPSKSLLLPLLHHHHHHTLSAPILRPLLILRPHLSSPSGVITTTTTHHPKHFSSLSSIYPSPHKNFIINYPTETKSQLSQLESELDETFRIPKEQDTDLFIECLNKAKKFHSQEEALDFLDESLSKVKPTEALICSVIWVLRNEWELGMLAFIWGDKLGFCTSPRTWDLIIWVLGKNVKFGVAWRLLKKMIQSSMNPQRAMLIMIESYAAANKPDKAIRTFQAMEKFKITHDSNSYYALLHALCKYGDVEVAEEFMLGNKNLFPLETESFNIILGGWCQVSLDVIEAKRIWREMSNYCITPNGISYTHMISCFSKVGNLFDSLRLYDEMKKRGWFPGLHVYNSLIYVLTRENCTKDALKIVDKIKETGLKPDSNTYNSMIIPLCEMNKLEEARIILADMVAEELDPTIVTYHAFVEGENFEGILELLKRMKESGCGPNGETFHLIFNKYLKLEQPDKALKMWVEMKKYEVKPDSEHYTVLIRGLAKFGVLVKAKALYDEMTLGGLVGDPKLGKLLKGVVKK